MAYTNELELLAKQLNDIDNKYFVPLVMLKAVVMTGLMLARLTLSQ